MSAAPVQNKDIPMKEKISDELRKVYKDILIKHLDERTLKEDKINYWMENILTEAKQYFINKFPTHDLFLYIYICPRDVYFRSHHSSISLFNTDWSDSVSFQTDNLYSVLYFFYYLHSELKYSLDKFENEIILKGNEIMGKYLDERKYNYDKVTSYNKSINDDHLDFICEKDNTCRCFSLNEIYQNPIKSKYYFRYLSHGKDIYSKLFQTYVNDSLTCCHILFFFK